MELKVTPPRALRGEVTVPGDKSISHRALMIGALAEGETVIENFLSAADCLSTLRCLAELGVEVEGPDNSGTVVVRGRGLNSLQEPADVLDAGNSGTTIRLMTGILAGQPFFSVITGDRSLRQRPMGRVVKPLTMMGARIWGRNADSAAPLAVKGGGLRPLDYRSPLASAQVKSAVLLAGLFADGETRVTEPVCSRDHTERMISFFGGSVRTDGLTVGVRGKPVLQGRHLKVPGDISSAAFIMVAAAILPDSDVTITGVGINPTRSGIVEVLQEMGARVELYNRRWFGNEPVADIRVRASNKLRGVTVQGDMIPRLIDELPVLAVAGAVADGETIVRDAGELKVKESNRIEAVVGELCKLGVDIEELPDGFAVRGGRPLRGARCTCRGDHRIAMAVAVAGLVAGGETVIEQAEAIDISFPTFSDVLNSLRVE